ncbi:MAG: Dipeptidyl peptidase IV [Rhodanobacteraceae bacterium]|jgi:dipeptidyl aminopeptidase/acylaminoacyl peptidase|nr:MAG: Dipeptidyl peptidase IV [Rhodanobacteraceae bacterium]
MNRIVVAGLVCLLVSAGANATAQQDPSPAAAAATPQKLTLEQIMADPDWIGPPVEDEYWGVDGRSVYFKLKRKGSSIRDLYRVDAGGGAPVKLSDAELASADGPAVFDHVRDRAAFIRHGDVFVREVTNGATRQVTRDDAGKFGLQISADGQLVSWSQNNDWYVWNAATGVVSPAATLKTEDNPADAKPDQLQRLQLSLFSTLRADKADKDAVRTRNDRLDAENPARAAAPFYLGDKVRVVMTSLSPDARWLLAVTVPKSHQRGKRPDVIHYVNESGYPEAEPARPYVGRNNPALQSLLLLDLQAHKQYPLPVDDLPGIHDDPLHKLRVQRIAQLKQEGHAGEAAALAAPKTRPVSVNFVMDGESGYPAIVWSSDGSQVALELVANDHKDRWIETVDFASHKLVTQNRLTDPAWINWSFNALGWLPDNRTLWFESEGSGWAQLFVKPLDGKPRALTGTGFEVSAPVLSPDGKWFYVRSNKQAPYDYDVYRVPVAGGALEQVTHFEGMDDFKLSPDGSKLAVLHSSAYIPPQLAVVDAGGGNVHELTDTRTPAYKAFASTWVEPQFVKVPSSHGSFGIWSKFYAPQDYDTSHPHPAVLFVHGAGYLQDVEKNWSYYFREQMFENLLLQEGYVVLDMDYRGSAGYGRDWRDAIYRHMGHPELEDLLDGKAWLVKHHHVDQRRVGIYGGSYGGFMTEMALLRAPGEFAAGAALRAPSDWTSYNDSYTSDILNTPQLDPEAYKISSPIEYAQNLQDPLLMMHGLIDNNVMPDDTIRLYQRFIELHKHNFWMSLYPTERHAFEHADDWYDEYRRIHELFTQYVKDEP